MKKFLLLPLFFAFNTFAAEKYEACTLTKDQVLNIACTEQCDRFVKWGLNRSARALGYKINIINLYNQRQSYDLAKVDAILIPGGADINPKYYTSKVDEETRRQIESLDHLVKYTKEGERRDPFEYNILQEYFTHDTLRTTPLLGICRGMQLLAVSQDIPLYVDIKAELGIRNRKYTLDKVHVTNGESVIYDIMKKRSFRAVELHHQAVRLDYFLENQEKWPHVNITAVSNGGHIVEAIELSNRPALGVQFHPEWTFGKVRRGVFNWFLNRACHKKNAEI